MEKKIRNKKILAVLLAAAGLLMSGYPFFSNYLYERAARAEIRYIREETQTMDKEKKQSYLLAARKYNEQLAHTGTELPDPFKTGENTVDDKMSYEDMLSFDSSGIMGFLEIPGIQVELPIYHGTSDTVLEKGVGHLQGSSFPVGGSSTHAVLTGHTGLNKARLFTDLTAMKKGDLFFVVVLDEMLAYRVDDIRICVPEDTKALRIAEGEDHVTLVTCTPYGVNDHRLLVRGTRTEYTADRMRQEKEKKRKGSLWMKVYKRALGMGAGMLVMLLLLLFFWRKARGGTR